MTIPFRAHTVEHHSALFGYVHPYIISYDAALQDLLIWESSPDANPGYKGKLEGDFREPIEIHLLSSNRLITRHIYDHEGHGAQDLVLHELPSGKLLDKMRLGRFDAVDTGKACLLAISHSKLITWRNGGLESGNGVVDIFALNDDDVFSLIETLYPPVEALARVFVGLNGAFQGVLLHCEPRRIVELTSFTGFPVGAALTRWASIRSEACFRTFPFISRVTTDDQKWVSHFLAHVRTSVNGIVTAHFEHPCDIAEPKGTTTIRSIDVSSLDLRWTTTIAQRTNKLRYIPSHGVVLVIGTDLSSAAQEAPRVSDVSIIILDEPTGLIKATHLVPSLRDPCSGILKSDCGFEIDVMASRNELIILFGDGQWISIPLDQFVIDGFKKFVNRDGYLLTKLFPDSQFAVPKNSRQRRDRDRGRWGWVNKALVSRNQIILECSKRGFVIFH
ncbi:hypothetical protein CVT26_002619 [Gymnopilus dilepis]|uniref:Uncharacterized protein n=1 Tax=Gymnopilus dilepis TaxID=231916 RepID=A0A409VEZ6_9AGAR|nr:hypothetical protein CVT26_002619 [Gymnopilus dilepis]